MSTADDTGGPTTDEMVQAQSLRGYRELVAELGGDAGPLLGESGIDPAALNELAAFISFEKQAELLERSAERLRCPDFGLRLAERQDLGILGILAVAMRYSATLGEALGCASKYIYIHNTGIHLTVITGGRSGNARLVFTFASGDPIRWAQVTEHGVGLTWRIISLLSEAKCHLQEVWFPHPAVAPRASYQARFPAPVRFKADEVALLIAPRDLTLPITENIAELRDVATRYLESHLPRGDTELIVQIRHAIEALLGTGACTIGEVASTLHMHERTLQRKLREKDTNFEVIKDETRRDLAERYLAQRDVSIAQIAALLDYSDQSSFGRSCRRWFDATPRQIRDDLWR